MFSGKTAIVTGGSRGIGRAIVQALARTGARVVFTYLQNKSAADEITNNDTIIGLPVDVTRFDQAKELVKQVKERFGRIDILVNNAGITRDKLIALMSEKDWDDVLNTNLKGVFNLTKPVIGVMLRQRSGSILNITSISGIMGMAGQVNYSSSKRSEEHTSELQSRLHLVCRLLLEKKKKQTIITTTPKRYTA